MNSAKQVVALLLVLQIVSVVYLWAVTLVEALSAGRFAIFLAIDLLSFALVGYVYTHEKWEETINRIWILVGSAGLILLLICSLSFS